MMYKRNMKPAPPSHQTLRVNISNNRICPPSGATWGPRSIPDTELIFIHTGTFALHLAGQTVQATENTLLIIFPGERHTFQSLDNIGSISCIHCDLPESETRTLDRIHHITDPEIPEGFRRCAETFLHPAPWREKLLHTILSEIWIRIQANANSSETTYTNGRAEEIANYIRNHCCEPITRNTLAQRFHLSPQHINYLFRTELHTTPTEVLHRARVKKAFLLMQINQLSVKEAAEQTGFYDTYHFSKVFKKAYGFSPGRTRQFLNPQ